MDDLEKEMTRHSLALEMYKLLYQRYGTKKKYVVTTIELAQVAVTMADELLNELNRAAL